MRIAVVSTPFVAVPPQRYGGTELVVANLVSELSARGHEVVLYATGDSRGAEVRAHYREPVWPPNPIHELNHARFAIMDVLADGHFDVVHAHVASALAF